MNKLTDFAKSMILVVNVVAQQGLYYLRILQYYVNDATSFNELLNVNTIRHATFKQEAWIKCLPTIINNGEMVFRNIQVQRHLEQ